MGRLPALGEWIARLLAGRFPWGSEAATNPSGLPVLFVLGGALWGWRVRTWDGAVFGAGMLLFGIVLAAFLP